MPFCLKNVGSTYQRLVDKAFQKKIGRNLEVCDQKPHETKDNEGLRRNVQDPTRDKHEADDSIVMTTKAEEELPDPWTLFTDGSSCIDGSGAGLILTDHEGTKFTYAMRFRFDATNNEAEYEALIAGLRIAKQM
nr:reverse transcriptase domain-containing protein [Tanacetum cinerariifolium]